MKGFILFAAFCLLCGSIVDASWLGYSSNKYGDCDYEFRDLSISSNQTYCDRLMSYCNCVKYQASFTVSTLMDDFVDNCVAACVSRGCSNCQPDASSASSVIFEHQLIILGVITVVITGVII